MTPRKATPPQTEDKSPLLKWVLTLLGALIIGLFAFLWNLNSNLAVMQNNDKYREEKVRDIDKNVSTLVNEIRSMKEMDIQSIKDRLKTLELEKTEEKK